MFGLQKVFEIYSDSVYVIKIRINESRMILGAENNVIEEIIGLTFQSVLNILIGFSITRASLIDRECWNN